MDPAEPAVTHTRPYFLPDHIDFDALPESVKLAFQAVVEPVYCETVLGAKTGLERSAGASVVFLLANEMLEQFAIGREMDFAQSRDKAQSDEFDKHFNRYLKLVGSKQKAAEFLMKVKTMRAKYGPLQMPPTLR